MRSTIFQALGGYPDIPIMEDVAFMKKLKKRQAKIQILNSPVSISDRRWKKEGVLYTTLRNLTTARAIALALTLETRQLPRCRAARHKSDAGSGDYSFLHLPTFCAQHKRWFPPPFRAFTPFPPELRIVS